MCVHERDHLLMEFHSKKLKTVGMSCIALWVVNEEECVYEKKNIEKRVSEREMDIGEQMLRQPSVPVHSLTHFFSPKHICSFSLNFKLFVYEEWMCTWEKRWVRERNLMSEKKCYVIARNYAGLKNITIPHSLLRSYLTLFTRKNEMKTKMLREKVLMVHLLTGTSTKCWST